MKEKYDPLEIEVFVFEGVNVVTSSPWGEEIDIPGEGNNGG